MAKDLVVEAGPEDVNFFGSVFSGTAVIWLTAIVMGILAPALLASSVSSWIGDLSSSPALVAGEVIIPQESDFFAAVIKLGVLFTTYVITVLHLFYFTVIRCKYVEIWATVLTLIGPLCVWFVIPMLFN